MKISELPLASTPLTGGELVPVVQSGVTSQVSVDNLTTGKSISVAGITTTSTALTLTSGTASGSGLVLAPTIVRLNADRTKPTNDTSLEAVFDSGNDALALAANTLYYFKGVYLFSKTDTSPSAAAMRIGFAFSNTQQSISYVAFGGQNNLTAGTYKGSSTGAVSVTAGLTGAGTMQASFEGWFVSNATTGGTIIPQFTQATAGISAAPSVLANSWIMIQPMSSSPSATLLAGNWS